MAMSYSHLSYFLLQQGLGYLYMLQLLEPIYFSTVLL